MVKIERQRYILFKIIIEEERDFDQKIFLKSIWQSIWKYFGMKQANKIGLWLNELDFKNYYGIIRCSNETKEIIISSLTFIKEINQKRIIISPIKTSASIKKIKNIKKRFINNNKAKY